MITNKSLWGQLVDLVTNFVFITTGSGAPTNGTSGTGVNITGPGSLYIDYTNKKIYQNTNTKASPTWTLVSTGVAGVDLSTAQVLTNKTLTAPIISTISNTGVVTLPTATDTLVGRATTDTLTNKIVNNQSLLNNFSTAAQTPAATTRTYLTGSLITVPTGKLQIGTMFMWTFDMTKTAAGSASSVIDIAIGTNGTTGDSAIVSFTKPAGTAAADTGLVTVIAIVRGPLSASGIITGNFQLTHSLAATGHLTIPSVVVNTVSSVFDVTTAGLKVGLCITTGASDAITIQAVTAQAFNL